MDTLRYGIIRAVCLGATFVADEDHLAATVFQLLQVRRRVPYVYDAPKCPEVVHHWFYPCHASNGVMTSMLFVEHLFSTYTAVLTASPQNHPRRPLALSMLLAVATNVPFRHPMTPFCYGL
jgi:hypothetical protein